MPTLLTREQFKEQVFARDKNKCVICGTKGVDAHHIMDRKLFPDGGYYLDNGATLCSSCHWDAERMVVSCNRIRDLAGISTVILPDYLSKDIDYDKWGIQLYDG